MASTFLGVGIAARGLSTSQASLLTTSNNISNVSTAGYSRQVVTQTAVGAAAVYSGSGVIGGGSEVTAIERLRNWRLDQSYWQENANQSTWQTKADALGELETILGEPADSGFTTVMTNFYDSLEELGKSAADASVRVSLRENGAAVCQYLNDASTRLAEERAGVNQDLKTNVTQLNAYAEQLAALNESISRATAAGAAANELQDQRDLLLDKLSGLTGLAVTKTAQGGDEENPLFSVSIGSQTLVSGGSCHTLACYAGADGMYGVRWADSGAEFVPCGGALAAQLELRDGDGSGDTYQGIPYYQGQLDSFARTLAQVFNEGSGTYQGHAAGYGTDGSTGICFFTCDDQSSSDFKAGGTTVATQYARVTAATLSLSKDVQDDESKIAAAKSDPTAADSGVDDNENANTLAQLCQAKVFGGSTPEDSMNAIITVLGTNSAYAQRLGDNLSAIVANVDTRRTSVFGVSTNEEASNLTKYEQAYEASAKVLTAWDDLYTTTLSLLDD